jgi:hypothetical protein
MCGAVKRNEIKQSFHPFRRCHSPIFLVVEDFGLFEGAKKLYVRLSSHLSPP